MEVGILIPLVLVIVLLLVVVAVLLSKGKIGSKGTKRHPTDTYVSTREESKVQAGKVCPNCGTELEQDSVFCTNCGAKQ